MSKSGFRCARNGAILALLLAIPLSGCALMGGGKKPALYAFGTSAKLAPASVTPENSRVTILYAGAKFERQSGNTGILTETGNSVAYIADARWIAPAPELFDAAAVKKLEGASPTIRVIGIGDRAEADYVLSIEVRRFSAVYTGGPDAPPETIVEARARLVRLPDRKIVGDWPVTYRENVGENRVTAIVASLDRGTDAVVSEIAGLTSKATGAGKSDQS